MSLKHGLLGLLNYEGSTTGYELAKFFDSSLNYFWHAKTSHIYRELSAMENAGWLSSERVIQEDKPNKRVYSITEQGKAELIEWLSSYGNEPEGDAKSPFLMRIFFGGEVGGDVIVKMLKERREKISLYAEEISGTKKLIADEEAEKGKKTHTKFWGLTALHGEIQCKAEIEWIDKAIAILEEE